MNKLHKPAVAILAGGLGTRLKPMTNSKPKALVEVAGRPFLFYQLELLRANGFTRQYCVWDTLAR